LHVFKMDLQTTNKLDFLNKHMLATSK
jgi:hypothetical protein